MRGTSLICANNTPPFLYYNMAESQLTNDVLRRLHSLFRSCLNFQSISPQLRQHNLITYHEWQVICNKDSHDDQVDEFLKCLPLKGRNCLNQLIECLQLSLDHAGHQDLLAELKKQVDRSNNDRQVKSVVAWTEAWGYYGIV